MAAHEDTQELGPPHPGLPATAGGVADLVGAELVGDPGVALRRLDVMDRAGPGALTFIRNPEFAGHWPGCRASAAVVTRGVEIEGGPGEGRALLFVKSADTAMRTLLTAASAEINRPIFEEGVHHTAFVHPTARVDPSAAVGPFCAVGQDSVIGPGVVLEAHVSVGAFCEVGARTRIHDSVILRPLTSIGEDSLLHPGTVLGADGFGFDRDENNIPVFIPHIAGVRVGDRVVIGGNCSIDRGKFSDTIIGDDVKIDNLTQIGHATSVGRGTVICGCCAIGGSCRIGDFVTIGGGVHMPDNVVIENGTIAAGGAFIASSVGFNDGEPWMGHPARPRSAWLRELRALKSFQRVRKDLKETMRAVRRLEDRVGDPDSSTDADSASASS